MSEREALKLALDAFGEIAWSNETQWQRDRAKEAITTIKEALANDATNDTSQERVDKTSVNVHEPVQWGVDWGRAGDSPCVSIIKRLPDGRIEVVAVEYGPQRTWVGLTDEEVSKLVDDEDWYNDPHGFARAIEAASRSKNT